jgi:hypothetical protein
MFHALFGLAGFAITAGAALLGYWQAKSFTRTRLRFVDGVHKASAPFLAAIGAALVALPVVWLVPLVGTGTALLFGAAVGLGVNSGAREIRRRIGAGTI